MGSSPSGSCRSTTPRSRWRPATRRVPSSHWVRPISTRCFATKRRASSRAITRSASGAARCRSIRSRGVGVARGSRSPSGITSMAGSRSVRAPASSARLPRPASPWTLPRRWTAAKNGGRPHVAWTAGPVRRRPTSAHRRHSSESGQITCQTEADRSLANNRCGQQMRTACRRRADASPRQGGRSSQRWHK